MTVIGGSSVYTEISQERERQEEKFPDQHLPDGTGGSLFRKAMARAKALCEFFAARGGLTWQHVMEEEVAEAFAEKDPEKLRAELIQVAAVAVRWIQDIDRAKEVSQT